MPQTITAAGGIVTNEQGNILLMYRRGKWDLPKGKVDEGEQIPDAAVREVEEETGLTNVELGEFIGITTHFYIHHNSEIEKETHWYAMKVSDEQRLVPQAEEDIEKLEWVSEHELAPYLTNTYDNIIQIVEKYFDDHNQVN
jgi:8-oxo-dGTP pyrophosphatase MutT (NUDIX family)